MNRFQQRLAWRLAMVGLAAGSLAPFGWSQPINDAFANRLPLRGEFVEIAASNEAATIESNEPAAVLEVAAGSVWWEWTPAESGLVTVSTEGSVIDTFLGVFRGDELASLSPVATNDDQDLFGGIFTSRVTLYVREGGAYQIVVAGVGSAETGFASGAIRLQIGPTAAETLPPWELATLDGQSVSSAALPGRLVLVDFWATWCAPCRAEIPTFIELQDRYGARGLSVLGVSVDTVGVDEVRAFVEGLGVNYLVAMSTADIETVFGGVPSIPTAFLLDGENRLIERHVGFRDAAAWEATINALLDLESPPDPVPVEIAIDGDGIRLTAPNSAAGWLLQTSPTPAGPWSDAEIEPEAIDDVALTWRLATDDPVQFFRLAHP